MTARIHATALVDPAARVGADVVIEPYAMIGPHVVVGQGCTIGPRVTIEGHTSLGAGCTVGVGTVLGTAPQDRKYAGEATRLRIGDDTVVREYVTVNRGTAASGETVIGNRCYLMAYVHVAHDCRLGDGVILANAVQLAGHVTIDQSAQVGGLTPIHQFTRIGRFAFVGGGSRVPQDVPPYGMVAGNPLRQCGINVEGLRRAGFSSDTRRALKRAFRLLFNSSLNRADALQRVELELGHVEEVAHLVEFLRTSSRGILV